MMDDPETTGNPESTGNQQGAGKQQPAETTRQRWRPSRRQRVDALIYAALFGLGLVVGAFVISGNTSSPNDSSACSYFWQFEAAPSMPGLVQAALSHNPGAGAGSHYLYEWLNTLEQQVSIPQITFAELQTDSTDGTAMGISAICQQLGFNSPAS